MSMLSLKESTRLKAFPLAGLVHEEDLLYFEGPLISHFRGRQGDSYLYYWCDTDGNHHRWMVFRVAERDIVRLQSQYCTLSEIVPSGSLDGFVYFVDVGSDGQAVATHLTPRELVPEEYLPVLGAMLDAPMQTDKGRDYTLLIDGVWPVDDLIGFPRLFQRVYSVLYGLNKTWEEELPSFPFRGGFSYANFYAWARSSVDRRNRPLLQRMAYASPGIIEFDLLQETAKQVDQCILDYKTNRKEQRIRHLALHRYIRKHGLNKLEPTNAKGFSKHNANLIEMAEGLLANYTKIDGKKVVSLAPRPFEAAKIAKSFNQSIVDLVKYEERGLVTYRPGARIQLPDEGETNEVPLE